MLHRYTELKTNDIDDAGRFSGFGAVFGNLDDLGDIIESGAFTATLREARASPQGIGRIKMLWGHNVRELPVGDWIKMTEKKDQGLYVEGQLDLELSEGPDRHRSMPNSKAPNENVPIASLQRTVDQKEAHET